MPSKKKNLSAITIEELPEMKDARIGIVVSEWNKEITDALLGGCLDALKRSGAKKKNITELKVPGSFELTTGAELLLKNTKLDAIICLGCVIQGETRHFDFICNAVANGVSNVAIKYYN